jgi:heptosyltransferase-2
MIVHEKPCRFKRLCEDCPQYDPMGASILVIKLAAMGDVVRTTPVAEALRRVHGRCRITWVVDAMTAPLLRDVETIDEVVPYSDTAVNVLLARAFDALYCLDKEPRAIALAARASAKTKKGFTMTPHGTLGVVDADAAYALRLGLDDPLKFLVNTRTYQDVIFEVCGLRFADEPIRIGIGDNDRAEADRLLASLGAGPFVGVNTGAGRVFATKRLPENQAADLLRRIASDLHATPVLLGGPDETERNARILAEAGVGVDAGTGHPIRRFAAIVSRMAAVVCADTLAMHLAVAALVPVVALFGPTCHQEVHLYGRGEKIVSAPWCSPCYKSECDHHTCMRDIGTDEIVDTLRRVMPR